MKVILGQIADIQIGYQVKGRIIQQADDTHSLVQTSDVNDAGEIAWEALASFTPVRKGTDRYQLIDGDILFLAKGARRVAAVVRNPQPHTLAVSTFFILRVRNDAVCLPEFLAWYLNVAARDDIAAIEQRGVTIPFVPKERLLQLEVELPTTATQRRIAALDELMHRERQLTAQLLEQRTRLINTFAQRTLYDKGDN